jgi:hypothetical protein
MEKGRGCPLFRGQESLKIGNKFPYCVIDHKNTHCQGSAKICEKPNVLRIYLQRRLEEFEKKGS